MISIENRFFCATVTGTTIQFNWTIELHMNDQCRMCRISGNSIIGEILTECRENQYFFRSTHGNVTYIQHRYGNWVEYFSSYTFIKKKVE